MPENLGDLSRTQLETLVALRRNPGCDVHQLREVLGLTGEHTVRNRLQRLRRKGYAKTNGLRGRDVRWFAVEHTPTDAEVAGDLPFLVQREIAASSVALRPFEVAAILGEREPAVAAAMVWLADRGIVAEVDGRYQAKHQEFLRRDQAEQQIRQVVDRWHRRRSVAERNLTSRHALEALINDLCQLLA